ncbi:10294_t:CDS:2 [Acaulospora morrowiae]|uniref:10294_t:CDS:1 n=1 Tax=Acaulospora morrowiae TaxID=94023 RepID=A0A9N9BA06_9GLOM|nr:10294_t:CDS:2 [Acaulospora morrowiae]
MHQEPPLVSFALTHVEFDPTDPLAFLFAFITLSPLALVVSYVTIILARREMVTINMFLEKLGKGYGMPSSHAQFMAYFTTFSILYLYTRITFGRNSQKFPISIGLIGLFLAVTYSRIYLNYHTPKQVMAGSIIGAFFAIAWFFFLENVLRPLGLFKSILDSRLARYFYLRDSSDIEDIVKIEYMNWLELNKRTGIKEANKDR